jgi:hypothetical protein
VSSILYGNFRIELLREVGGRVDRVLMRQALPTVTARRVLQGEHPPLVLVGRDEELQHVRAAVYGRRPFEFTAACGYGKTTLLQQVAASSPGSSVYLRVGSDGLHDVLTRLVDELYASDQRLKLTPARCAQVLSPVHAVVVLDDVDLDPEQVRYLLSVLPGCSVVLGAPQSKLGRQGISRMLTGLPDDAAMQLISRDLGRPITGGELTAMRRLVAAVDGQPLHLRQVAALVREPGRSFQGLARIAGRNPGVLDRLSVNGLAVAERRALAVLALAAGALLPAQLVGAMGDVAKISDALRLLHRHGLAEQRGDRFGLPICKRDGYRKLVLDDLDLGAAVRQLINWFAARDPTAQDSVSAADAALSVVGWAAERGDWRTVVRLVQVVEPVLTLAGRWQASRHALAVGLQAAQAIGDHVAEALFSHEQGTLALCLDELAEAQRLLLRALDLRERAGDRDGAAVTRHNLQILQQPPPPPRRRYPVRKMAVIGAGVLVGLAGLAIGILDATASKSLSHSSTLAAPPSAASTGQTSSGGPPSSSSASGSSTGGPISGSGSSAASTPASSSSARPHPTQVLPPAVPKITDCGLVDIAPGTPPVSCTVPVSNPNGQPLTLAQAGPSGDAAFTITQDGCSTVTLPPQGSCNVTVAFAPSTLGDHLTTLTIGASPGQASTELTGKGYITLTVTISGPGTVQGLQDGICSPPGCTQRVTAPQDITLTATPNPTPSPSSGGSLYPLPNVWRDWTGDCAKAQGPTCVLSAQDLTVDKNVGADFGHPIQ